MPEYETIPSDFINDEIATFERPVLSGISRSIYNGTTSKRKAQKKDYPVFQVREIGAWDTVIHRKYVPHNNHGHIQLVKLEMQNIWRNQPSSTDVTISTTPMSDKSVELDLRYIESPLSKSF